MPFNDRELFARLIQCEAGGEGDDGMKAVAATIMNRVHVPYGEYLRTGEGSLRRIMEQPGQFDCMRFEVGGMPNEQTVYNMNPTQLHYDIADWAMSGGRYGPVGESLWYMNPFVPDCPTYFPYNESGVIQNRINNHCFFIPTSRYAET